MRLRDFEYMVETVDSNFLTMELKRNNHYLLAYVRRENESQRPFSGAGHPCESCKVAGVP